MVAAEVLDYSRSNNPYPEIDSLRGSARGIYAAIVGYFHGSGGNDVVPRSLVDNLVGFWSKSGRDVDDIEIGCGMEWLINNAYISRAETFSSAKNRVEKWYVLNKRPVD